jgi:hypothetical protein
MLVGQCAQGHFFGSERQVDIVFTGHNGLGLIQSSVHEFEDRFVFVRNEKIVLEFDVFTRVLFDGLFTDENPNRLAQFMCNRVVIRRCARW